MNLKESSNSEELAQRFTGKERDRVSGLDYFGARYYDSDVEYWLSPDAARQFGNLYLYSGNGTNPLNFIDPNGLNKVYTVNVSLSDPTIPKSMNNPLTHTFSAVTDDNNKVLSTYSFGMGAKGNLFGSVLTFDKNYDKEMQGAQNAINAGMAFLVNDGNLADYMDLAYNSLKGERIRYNVVTENCKDGNLDLLARARGMQLIDNVSNFFGKAASNIGNAIDNLFSGVKSIENGMKNED